MGNYKLPLGRGSKLKFILQKKKQNSSGANIILSESVPKQNSVWPSDAVTDELAVKRRGRKVINFYDLGQRLVSGDWKDIDFAVLDRVELDVAPFLIDEWDLLKAEIFDVDPADWKTQYRKLDYEGAERYGLDFQVGSSLYPVARNGSRLNVNSEEITGSVWTPSGLAIPSSGVFQTRSFSAFYLMTDDTDKCKITTSDTYSSEEVNDFVLGQNADIFLVPRIVSLYSFKTNEGVDIYYLINGYRPISREFFLGRNVNDEYSYFSYHSVNTFPSPTVTGTERDALIEYMITAVPNVAVFYEYVDVYDADYITASDWATSEPDLNTFSVFNQGFAPGLPLDFQIARAEAIEGSFLGAVLQNGQMYYFWSKGTVSHTEDYQTWLVTSEE